MIGDTICAPATPALNSAIAAVRISGPDAFKAADFLKPRLEIKPRNARYASFFRNGKLIDDVIFIAYPSPASYTGEDTVEIFCHGNPLIVQNIIESLSAAGIRPAGPGEFTRRAFLNGKLDLTAAEAVHHIITARSSWEIEASLKQMHGSMRIIISEIKSLIIELKADVEISIDFPEDDIPDTLPLGYSAKAEKILTEILSLLQRCRIGERASKGINIAIAGKPNVGKSSLLNLIVNSERAIVSEIPGTTRDLIRETVEINGLPVNIIDTAGINDSARGIEKIGVELSRKNIDSASLIIAVFDPVQGFGGADNEILDRITGRRALCIVNKIDSASSEKISDLEFALGTGRDIIRMSAKTGAGFSGLHGRLSEILSREIPGYEDSFAADARVLILLERGAELSRAVIKLLDEAAPAEIVSFELQSTIDTLSEITGEISPDDVLGSIFARFCIGK